MKKLRRLYAAIILLTTALVCHADTIMWTNAAGGSFQEPLNWSPNAVPTTNDTAVFDLADAPYTVTWQANVTNHTQIIRAGTVTFDLKGYTYSLDKYSSNTIGRAENMALVAYTNGTIRRLNVAHTGSLDQYFHLRGTGTTLYLRNAAHLNVAYYPYMYADTRIVIDGPDASFQTYGGAKQTAGHIIVTNGGFLNVSSGTALNYNTSFIHVSGPGYRAVFPISLPGLPAGASILIDNGAIVQHATLSTVNTPNSISGTITLGDARWYDGYSELNRGWRALTYNLDILSQ